MGKRTTWMVITAALIAGWAVVVALLVLAFTDWSSGIQVLAGGAMSGFGAGAILWLRMGRLPESSGVDLSPRRPLRDTRTGSLSERR